MAIMWPITHPPLWPLHFQKATHNAQSTSTQNADIFSSFHAITGWSSPLRPSCNCQRCQGDDGLDEDGHGLLIIMGKTGLEMLLRTLEHESGLAHGYRIEA